MAFDLIRTSDVTPVSRERLMAAKRGFTTRRVKLDDARTLVAGSAAPRIGDLVLAVVEKIGSHAKIELPSGRRAQLSVGDEIIVAYGNRYAPDQFEALIGENLDTCHLVAAGGVASTKVAKHEAMASPTRITPVGLLAGETGERLNLSNYAVSLDTRRRPIKVVYVAGTSMNAGKTMTAAGLVYALAKAGHKVAGIKSTGTGAGGDLWLMSDMGAHAVLDFTDAGLPSTYLAPVDQIERTVLGLIGHAADQGCDVAVVEVADGLQHEETATLLRSAAIREAAVGIVFAANDALGAKAGLRVLEEWDYRVLALSGQLTRSPLAMREAARSTGMSVVTLAEIQAGCLTSSILAPATYGASAFLAAGLEAA
jgi:molybdopterin-guanine dinucleotide biosynthesis protein